MREITTHHDGHGLAESIGIQADDIPEEQRFGGASHHYTARISYDIPGEPTWSNTVAKVLEVQFQKGPRNTDGSTPGIIDNVLLAIVADRLRCFQAGPFPSAEGQNALELVEAAMACFKRRADERATRGVLGKAEP